GILPSSGWLVRPMLFATKEEIREYAEEHHIAFREDKSNLENNFQRNFIRNKVLPLLEEINPSMINSMYEGARIRHQIEEQFILFCSQLCTSLARIKNEGTEFIIEDLKKAGIKEAILLEFFQKFHFNQEDISNLLKAFDTTETKKFSAGEYDLIKDRS